MNTFKPIDFIRESNRIENIEREPTPEEIEEYHRFMNLTKITVEDLEQFVSVYAPGNVLRDKKGLDVRIGNYYPIPGGPAVLAKLTRLLKLADNAHTTYAAHPNAYKTHIAYEKLHPFTDGNGRSGRMLWMWQMKYAPLGFLHTFYYQTLSHTDRETN